MNVMTELEKNLLYYDGATGTYLQNHGLQVGEIPELLNITHSEILIQMHREYLEGGTNILLANTFGAHSQKLSPSGYTTDEVIGAGIANAREAIAQYEKENPSKPHFVSLDVGPLGRIMEPFGDLSFEEAYGLFKEIVDAGVKAGVDLITIETMSDLYELKAAILAAKENASLPVFVTAVFEENGRMLSGTDVETFVTTAESLGVDALGVNCSLGPKQMLPIVEEIIKYSRTPVIVQPNAGLPTIVDGKTQYDITDEEFSDYMVEFAEMGVSVLGGCCGTNPEYIRKMTTKTKEKKVEGELPSPSTKISSYGKTVSFGKKPLLIGERLNPTGKKSLQEAMKAGKIDSILSIALEQEEFGCHILDVNCGLPEFDEENFLPKIIGEIQGVTSLPLQIDTTNPKAMEKACRKYNGRPLLNSVNGKQESMDEIFPIAKKYGAVVVALCLDESGIPNTAEDRLAIAEKIQKEAEKYGIGSESLVFDPLALTISSDGESAKTCLETIRLLSEKGWNTTLGVSNISFGLPYRDLINGTFFSMALYAGLTSGIINPLSQELMDAYSASLALLGQDESSLGYIEKYKERTSTKNTKTSAKNSSEEHKKDLGYAIEKGLMGEAKTFAQETLQTMDSMEIIQTIVIPSLNRVGEKFENKTLFLPQLLMSADAASAAFSVIRENMQKEANHTTRGRVLVATVKGDIHDIGKNITKALLENYGFEVLDLGKDVPPEKILETVQKENLRFVGLSALMTTTVVFMKETIALLREHCKDCKILVGGAVLTEAYAQEIHADAYGKDAMATVRYVESLEKENLL